MATKKKVILNYIIYVSRDKKMCHKTISSSCSCSIQAKKPFYHGQIGPVLYLTVYDIINNLSVAYFSIFLLRPACSTSIILWWYCIIMIDDRFVPYLKYPCLFFCAIRKTWFFGRFFFLYFDFTSFYPYLYIELRYISLMTQ